jgi:Cu/Ag efflux protein CusF
MTYLPRFSSLFTTFVLSAGLALPSANASAQAHMHGQGQPKVMPAAVQDDPAALSEGEVKKVDKDTGKLTMKHGPLNNLDMPAMTMAFKVREPAMLDRVKAGDQVRFRVERVNAGLTVTRLELRR